MLWPPRWLEECEGGPQDLPRAGIYTAPQPALMSWPQFQPYKHAMDGVQVQYFSIAEELCKTC